MEILSWVDYAGVAVFAATGALAASRKQLDFIAFVFLAATTGIGGGTLRDAILGLTPVFWVQQEIYLYICVVVAAVVFFTAHRFESRYRLLLWLDAIGMAIFCVKGAQIGLAATGSPTAAVVTGILSSTFGGVLRDILSGEQSVLMRREIYVTAALFGSAVWVLGDYIGSLFGERLGQYQHLSQEIASVAGFAVALFIRGGALYWDWKMPNYKNAPGRTIEEVEALIERRRQEKTGG
ncbi:trimeric intracellular cation channel family protein [Kiloniella laminariae]|uniref:Trimeric intracellular cation channel family protein n=1 Tax=Kiloniella laminariae TaxID=454162 RepID=A0ABT4LF29_9PROT|nr:trimeric intracellular cation channel family protein [Kiloniella laminariae]MCZ4279697.1 trimeric intracellular cation channel family protein [Kiloniella laminariae]